MSYAELAAWAIIGLLAGSLAGLIIKRKREGFGWITNLLFGLAGAFIGGIAFDKLDIELGLGSITISLNKLVAAICGSLAVVFLASFLESRRKKSE